MINSSLTFNYWGKWSQLIKRRSSFERRTPQFNVLEYKPWIDLVSYWVVVNSKVPHHVLKDKGRFKIINWLAAQFTLWCFFIPENVKLKVIVIHTVTPIFSAFRAITTAAIVAPGWLIAALTARGEAEWQLCHLQSSARFWVRLL